MLASGKTVLDKAHKGNYAVGSFNINNMEIIQAIVAAAERQRSPVILSTSEGALDYAGMDYLFSMAKLAAKKASVPIVINLDHGKDLDVIKQAIDIGYTSIMIDGSHFDFDKNIEITKKVVRMAHKEGISVEGELGTIGGSEDKVSARQIIYTDPDAAEEFVKKTGVDYLAIAIGTSHGAYKFEGAGKLDLDRLKAIKQRLDMPIVLHGASGVPDWILKKAELFGAKLPGAEGVSDEQIVQAVSLGINKINTDTDLRLAFTAAVREIIYTKPQEFDPRKLLGPARDLMQQVVEHRMQIFGSAGKAK